MYTFRILSEEHVVTNHNLGESYSVSYPKTIPFERYFKQFDGTIKKEDFKSVIEGESGFTSPIEKDSMCFIVSESGKTFERL